MLTQTQRLTRDEYRAFVQRPENIGRVFEFIDGEIIEKMSGGLPSNLAAELIIFIGIYLRQHPIGFITGADGEYDLPDGNTLIPDVGFISKARKAALDADAIPFAPDLAVEIQSKSDRKRDLRKKAEQYIDNGARLVWLVWLDKTVEVYTDDLTIEPLLLRVGDTLDGGAVLPGFALPLAELFPAQEA
jgi:Uma2 family endonuclease